MAAALAVAGTVSCTAPAPPAPSSSAAVTTTTAPSSVSATVGALTTFTGLELTVTALADPAPPEAAKAVPDPGERYVRVTVKAFNPGPAPASFTPLAQAQLVDDEGGVHRALPELYPGDLTGSDVAAATGVEGGISFSLAEGRTPARVVFADRGVTTTVVIR